MNARGLIIGLLALGLAGLAVVLTQVWLSGQNQPAPQEAQETEQAFPMVLVADANLPVGTELAGEHVRWIEWKDSDPPAGFIRDNVNIAKTVLGKVVRSGFLAGEPILLAKITAVGKGGVVSVALRPGMRAVTIEVDAVSGLGGLVLPGDRVDVILAHQVLDEDDIMRRVSETVIRDVRVMGIDTRYDGQNREMALGDSVTLEVTPKQAEKIAITRRMGTYSLSLRSLVADRGLPAGEQSGHTLESEVSRLVPPVRLEGGKETVSVSRGAETREIEFERKDQ